MKLKKKIEIILKRNNWILFQFENKELFVNKYKNLEWYSEYAPPEPLKGYILRTFDDEDELLEEFLLYDREIYVYSGTVSQRISGFKVRGGCWRKCTPEATFKSCNELIDIVALINCLSW